MRSGISTLRTSGTIQIDILDRQLLKILDKFGKQGAPLQARFGTIHEIPTHSKGSIYTAELRTRRIQKFIQK